MKKGFTLIELLAVIVILAIIAVIATPIVLNIINNSKSSSQKRSLENYTRSVENYIADYLMKNNALPSFEILNSNINNFYNGNVSCAIIEIHEDGSIYLNDCYVSGKPIPDFSYGVANIKLYDATIYFDNHSCFGCTSTTDVNDKYLNYSIDNGVNWNVISLNRDKKQILSNISSIKFSSVLTNDYILNIEITCKDDLNKIVYQKFAEIDFGLKETFDKINLNSNTTCYIEIMDLE